MAPRKAWVPSEIWRRPDWARCTVDARLLWLGLATSELRSVIPGIALGGPQQVEIALALPIGIAEPLAAQLETRGLLHVDLDVGLWWLPLLASDLRNVRIATIRRWGREWEQIPDCPLRAMIREALIAKIRNQKPALIDEVTVALS